MKRRSRSPSTFCPGSIKWPVHDHLDEGPIKILFSGRPVLKDSYPVHRHSHSELHIVLGGNAKLKLGESLHDIGQGDVFVFREGVPHGFEGFDRFQHATLFFDLRTLQGMGGDIQKLPGFQKLFRIDPTLREEASPRFLRLSKSEIQRVEMKILGPMIREQQSRKSGFQTLALARFAELAVDLSRMAEAWARSKSTAYPVGLIRLAKLIETRYLEKIALSDMSEAAGMPVRTLHKMFRKVYGAAPMNHVISLRLAHAAGLLAKTKRSITEIAFDSGFSDSNYFSRMFRKVYGITPGVYRRTEGHFPDQ